MEIDVLDLLNVRFTLRGVKIKLSLAAAYFVKEDKKGTIQTLISQDLAKRIHEYLCAARNGGVNAATSKLTGPAPRT